MNRKQIEIPITSFTLSDLLALSGKSSGFALLRASQAASSASDMEPFRFPCRIDAFLIGVGAEGEATVSFNLNEYRLHKGLALRFRAEQHHSDAVERGFQMPCGRYRIGILPADQSGCQAHAAAFPEDCGPSPVWSWLPMRRQICSISSLCSSGRQTAYRAP